MVESAALQIPLPPLRYRFLVGLLEESRFENATGELILPEIPADNYASVFDFGCGCGRLARVLLQQKQRPQCYLGIDINTRMIEWCSQNLTPVDQNFTFLHHDVFNPLLGQFNSKNLYAPFPAEDETFTLFLAYSVFTHLLPEQTEFYLAEMSRILRPGGIAYTSWFFCDKKEFPMMQDFQNALYINVEDPTNAVIYDRDYFETLLKANGLGIYKEETDFQNNVYLIKLGKTSSPGVNVRASALAQFQERPSIPRSMDNQASTQADFELPGATSDTNPELLAARIVTKDTNLIEKSLFIGEMTPVVFDLENSGKAAWLTSEGNQDKNQALSEMPVKIQAIWQHGENDDGEVGESSDIQPFYGKVLLDLPQSTPVLPGTLVRVPLLLYTPTQPGNYLFTLKMVLGDNEWPGEPLYSQNVEVLNAPENSEPRLKRDKELELIQLYDKLSQSEKELTRLHQSYAELHQSYTQLHQLLTNKQGQLSVSQQAYQEAHDAFTMLQKENIEVKEAYKKLESWASEVEQNLNRVPLLIRRAINFNKKKKS